MPPDGTMTPDQFAAKIKEKYPAYADIPNHELTDKILKKYPQYGERIKAAPSEAAQAASAPKPHIPHVDMHPEESNVHKLVTGPPLAGTESGLSSPAQDPENRKRMEQGIAVGSAIVNPVETAGALAGGYATGKAAKFGAKAAGADEKWQKRAEVGGELLGGAGGAMLGHYVPVRTLVEWGSALSSPTKLIGKVADTFLDRMKTEATVGRSSVKPPPTLDDVVPGGVSSANPPPAKGPLPPAKGAAPAWPVYQKPTQPAPPGPFEGATSSANPPPAREPLPPAGKEQPWPVYQKPTPPSKPEFVPLKESPYYTQYQEAQRKVAEAAKESAKAAARAELEARKPVPLKDSPYYAQHQERVTAAQDAADRAARAEAEARKAVPLSQGPYAMQHAAEQEARKAIPVSQSPSAYKGPRSSVPPPPEPPPSPFPGAISSATPVGNAKLPPAPPSVPASEPAPLQTVPKFTKPSAPEPGKIVAPESSPPPIPVTYQDYPRERLYEMAKGGNIPAGLELIRNPGKFKLPPNFKYLIEGAAKRIPWRASGPVTEK
jgi:hypothetical protein